MKYIVTRGLKTMEFDTAEDAAACIAENISEDVYDEMLDECYRPVEIIGLEYAPSVALRRLDEVAYRCGYSDYCDGLYADILYDIERMGAGDVEEFYGDTVTCEEDGAEE